MIKMFGLNRIYKLEKSYKGTLGINNIFYTIQGEGIYAGSPAIFIRLRGCNLSCKMCDEEFDSGQDYLISEVIETVKELTPLLFKPLVVITGGEPFLQWGLNDLVKGLLSLDYLVQIETAGTVICDNFEIESDKLTIVCSPKTGKVHKKIQSMNPYYKYVIKAGDYDESDGMPNKSYMTGELLKIARLVGSGIYIVPCDEHDSEKNALNLKKCIEISMKFGYKISLQQHKIMNLK